MLVLCMWATSVLLLLRVGWPPPSSRYACLHTYAGLGYAHAGGGKKTSGVSGTLFMGNKIRWFPGRLLFSADESPMQKVAVPAPRQVQRLMSAKWAVCTTIFSPSEAIMGVAAMEGWMVVVVGDKGSAEFNFTAPNLVYLKADEQQAITQPLGKFGDILPWQHFGRKNVGYLFAISHGAQIIWDFDDDNVLKPGVVPAMPAEEATRTLQFSEGTDDCLAYNVYPHFMLSAHLAGMPPAWPRGFPLDHIRKPCNYSLGPGGVSSIAVVQSLADNDPDVDGIFRLTRGVPFNFDANSRHTIIVPAGTLTPWNAQVG